MTFTSFKGPSVAAFVMALVLGCASSACAQTPAVWLSPSGSNARDTAAGLSRSDAPWPKAADNVAVFELSPAIVATASDAQLASIFAALRKRGVGLAIEYRMLTVGPDGCGEASEGYHAGSDAPVPLAARIARLGGDVRYIAMDAPLWYGRDGAAPGCKATVEAIARDAAAGVRAFASVFPKVAVGDVEPVGGAYTDVQADWGRWIEAYAAAAGKPLAFVQADTHGVLVSADKIGAVAALVRSHGIPFGVIYSDDPAPDARGASPDLVVLEAAPAELTVLADRYAGRRATAR